MTKDKFLELFLTELELQANEGVERDHYGHYEVPDKEKKVEAKQVEALQFMVQHAVRNCS